MTEAFTLKVSKNVQLGTAATNIGTPYIAVRSMDTDSIPFIKWTVLKTTSRVEAIESRQLNGHAKSERNESLVVDIVEANSLIVNPKEFGMKYLRPYTKVVVREVSPPELTHIILTTNSSYYNQLEASKNILAEKLPQFVHSGMDLPHLHCHVEACEPSDAGLVPKNSDKLSISVIESIQKTHPAEEECSSVDFALDEFLNSNASSLSVQVHPLRKPIPSSVILPAVPHHTDPENMAFLKVESLAKLGVFSGDPVKIQSDDGRSRIVLLFSHPDPQHAVDDTIYLSPLLYHNLGGGESLTICKLENGVPSNMEIASNVTLSRVSSPLSTEKMNQTASLRGLKSYFSKGISRVVQNNDLIAIPINTSLAKLLGSGSSISVSNGTPNPSESLGVNGTANHSNATNSGQVTNHNNSASVDDEVDLQFLHDNAQPDQVVWFQVTGLPHDRQMIINPAHTRMVQSGLVQQLLPTSDLNWQSYLGLVPPFNYLQESKHGKLFPYAHYLYKLLKGSLTKRGGSIKTTILLTSSKRGVGKATLLSSLAASLGMHEMVLDAHDLIGDSDSKTLGLLKARLERAATTSHCLVSILHLEAISKKNDIDGKDTPLINGLVDVIDEILAAENNLVLAATVPDPDMLTSSVRNKFKFEVHVTVPTEREREAIFSYLNGTGSSAVYCLPENLDSDVVLGYSLRGDVTLESLALQSAGLIPPDLKAISRNARYLATSKANVDKVLCSGGFIKIEPEDFNISIQEARGKFSDSIGAPKIPNVGWKDVGGLDMVKGEILDTIDMPLKHPELFASGLKKRSGILFYGPPGTGKTLLAKAIATNFSLNFFSVKGPELLNMYIGESEANVRRVFQKARDAKPCVVFFDELDSVAPKRGNKGDSGGVMDRIVSQLLAELDGMSEGGDGVFVVGATNRPDLLDEALLRPGRFDKMLYLGVSDTHEKQRTILQALTRKFDLAEDVDLTAVANSCPFTYTGADFYAMVSDAMLNAMTRTAGEIDRKILAYNDANPEDQVSIRKWFQSVATESDIKVCVSNSDFYKAQRDLVPSISAEELQHYLRVRNIFEGKPQTNSTAK